MFTFIMAAYKSKFLKESIESILNQSLGDLELIIIDDCSPHNIEEVVSEFLDSRVRFYRNKENSGPYKLVENWNKGIELATGNYVIFASDDDFYHKDFLYHMSELIHDNPTSSLFHCRIDVVNGDGVKLASAKERNRNEGFKEHFYNRVINRELQVLHEFIVRKEAINAIGGLVNFPLAWYSDDATWLKLSLEFGKSYTSKVLFSWRHSGQNISAKFDQTKLKIIASDEYSKNIGYLLDRAVKIGVISDDERCQMWIESTRSIRKQKIFDITDTRGLSWMILVYQENSFVTKLNLILRKIKKILRSYLQ